jgi:urea transport system permease protein
MPLGNLLPPTSPLHVSNFTLNLFGKFLTYAILALGLDLLWGYAGVLSLGHGVFFGLGAYAMGMHLMLEIGSKSVYQSALPDFMVWNQVKELPLFWRPFYSAPFTLLAIVLVPALVRAGLRASWPSAAVSAACTCRSSRRRWRSRRGWCSTATR